MREQTRHRVRSIARTSVWKAHEFVARPTVDLRLMPSYLIVGGQRCGTTSLQELLSTHPQISTPFMRKGIHYFDTSFTRGSAWYQAHFPFRSRNSRITGEASPYYLFHPAVPQRIHDLIPEVKIVILLRDPVERAISHHKHEVRRGFEELDVGPALEAEPQRLEGEEAQLLEDPSYRSYNHQHFSYVARGLYAKQVSRYLDLFPGNVLTLEAESMWNDPASTMREAYEFLDIDEWMPTNAPHMNATRPSEVRSDIRDTLKGAFSESNAELVRLLNRRFSWA